MPTAVAPELKATVWYQKNALPIVSAPPPFAQPSFPRVLSCAPSANGDEILPRQSETLVVGEFPQ